MKNKLLIALTFLPLAVSAETLSLRQYLENVQKQNPDARSASESVESYTGRLRESELMFQTELYANVNFQDNKAPQLIPAFMGTETKGSEFRVGLRKTTNFGLGVDLSFDGQRTTVLGIDPQITQGVSTDSYVATGVLVLTQSLWRNGFGEASRADEQALSAKNSSELMDARYRLKTIMLNAENAYWSVVSYNEVIRLQKDNVERARRLQNYMAGQERRRLVDDTDAIQADAALESRSLELQTSMDERARLIRELNTLSGSNADSVGDMEAWPTENMMEEAKQDPTGHMSREDFEKMRAQARAARADAISKKSKFDPQFDIKAQGATNGRNGTAQNAIQDAQTTQFPAWFLGLTFSMPLDFGLLGDVRQGYRAAQTSADAMDAEADFSEARAWDDLVKQKHEAQGQYQRAVRVEKVQADLVNRERQRLLNGRATTFESITFEQNLASAQIQRVKSQLALLKIHNTLKTFEVKK